MCSYCGCSGVPAIGDLMDEHAALVDQAGHVRIALSTGDLAGAMTGVTSLVGRLTSHVRREEDGVFAALRDTGEFVAEVDALEGEHRGLETTIAGLDISSPDFATIVRQLLDDLDVHVQREELGIFPASVVTLGAEGWSLVDRAHARTPSFLLDPDDASPDPAPV
ncbi:MAG: hemerythrin domain-containing protein [Nocardioides sp.]